MKFIFIFIIIVLIFCLVVVMQYQGGIPLFKESFGCNPFVSSYYSNDNSSACKPYVETSSSLSNTSNGFDFVPKDNLDRKSHFGWGDTLDWYLRSGKPSGNVILQDKGGYVGIGTASPTSTLDVVGDVSVKGNVYVKNPSGSSNSIQLTNDNAIRFNNNNNVQIRGVSNNDLMLSADTITFQGNSSITSNAPLVHTSGIIKIGSPGNSNIVMGGNSNQPYIHFRTGGQYDADPTEYTSRIYQNDQNALVIESPSTIQLDGSLSFPQNVIHSQLCLKDTSSDDTKCMSYQTLQSPACRSVETPWNDDGSVSVLTNPHKNRYVSVMDMAFLDRHNLQCNTDEYLSQIKLQRNAPAKKIQYTGQCCKLFTDENVA